MGPEDVVDELTGLIGREVYTTTGRFVGDVADVTLNFDEEVAKGLAMTNVNLDLFGDLSDARGVMIPYRWIRSVGDIIVVNDTVERMLDNEQD